MTLGLAVLLLLGQEPAIAGGQNIREQMACAPMSAPAPVEGLRVAGSAVHGRVMFATGDTVLLNAGSEQGVQNGQVYYVRRKVRDHFTPPTGDFIPSSIHTAGWVTIVDTKEYVSIATVTHACDALLYGDFLEPFTSPVVPAPALGGQPDYANPAHIVMGDERRQIGSEGMLMLIDRGTEQGARAGQTLTIYRETMNGLGPIVSVGRATILSVAPKSAVVRIDSSHEAVYVGDLAAINRIQ